MTTPLEARPRYRKVLYLRQPYPDNWVDPSFLADLQRNVNVHPASLPLLLRQTLPITQHLACTFIFVSVFVRLSQRALAPAALLSFSLCIGLAFKLWSFLIVSGSPSSSRHDSTRVIPLVALYLLSPALKTLTRSTTSDSIWAVSGTLFAINLVCADCRAIPPSSSIRPRPFATLLSFLVTSVRSGPNRERLTRRSAAPLPSTTTTTTTLSLTAALSGSTVLASRLDSNLSVFSLLLFSTLWFGQFPTLRSSLALKPTLVATWFLSTVALVETRHVCGTVAMTFCALALLGSSVVAPLVRGWLMIRYKDRIRGPWDQAVPQVA